MSLEDFTQGVTTVICDHCDARHEEKLQEGYSFQKAWAKLKDDGWRSYRSHIDGVLRPVWVHVCPACRDAGKLHKPTGGAHARP